METSNARALRTADHIVPLYDPAVFERYPDGVIAASAVSPDLGEAPDLADADAGRRWLEVAAKAVGDAFVEFQLASGGPLQDQDSRP